MLVDLPFAVCIFVIGCRLLVTGYFGACKKTAKWYSEGHTNPVFGARDASELGYSSI